MRFLVVALSVLLLSSGHASKCAQALKLLEESGIALPIGVSKDQLAHFIDAFQRMPHRKKFEAIIIGGSRTHFSFGHKAKANESGQVTSDTDMQLIPTPDFFQSAGFAREWPNVASSAADFLNRTSAPMPKPEFIMMPNLATPLSTLLKSGLLSSAEIENRIDAKAAAYKAEHGDWTSRDAEKRFYLSHLSREVGAGSSDRSGLHTTEAIVLLRNQGPQTETLKAQLEARGFRNVLIVP